MIRAGTCRGRAGYAHSRKRSQTKLVTVQLGHCVKTAMLKLNFRIYQQLLATYKLISLFI